jgi:hypothetical protein
VSGIRCQVSGIRYQVSGVRCQVSGVRCQGEGEQLRSRRRVVDWRPRAVAFFGMQDFVQFAGARSLHRPFMPGGADGGLSWERGAWSRECRQIGLLHAPSSLLRAIVSIRTVSDAVGEINIFFRPRRISPRSHRGHGVHERV